MENTSQKEQYTDVENTSNTDYSNKETVKRTEIGKTGLEIIELNRETKDKFIAWGKYRVTPEELKGEELEQVIEELYRGAVNWQIVGAIAASIATYIINEEKGEK